ncbi:hypothetical protein [Amycolatopsis sp. CA-230715]|uniref:hypothetical protein n=1 Tax=Amycolatopsis sp. CA-230715 TaxID=2745196 RepID=UPI001C011E0A|nr:hypothetical protein [Amycolatopsis sp. CA-230715]QWF76828.1 hypothetical protein HUW46_00208 [Amycolatopsis sp. CA-230715]
MSTVPVSRASHGYRAVLRAPGMRAVFAAHAVSMAGTIAAEVALSILVFERTRSPLLSALVLACSFLPHAFGGTALSPIADRFPARGLLVCCDLLSAACVAAMLVPGLPVVALLALLVVTSVLAPVFQGARAGSLAHLLDADLFPVGRSLLRAVSQSTVLAGFGVGSALVATIGTACLLAADVASFLVSAVLIGLCTPSTPVPRRDGGSGGSGFRAVFARVPVRRLLLLSWAAPAFSSVASGLAVAYTAQAGAPVAGSGALLAGYATGTVAGEIVVATLRPHVRRRLLFPLLLLNQLPLAAFAFVPPVWCATALLVLSGTGSAFNQCVDPVVLAAADPAARGRLFTVQSGGLMAVQGAGIAVAGAVAALVAPATVIGTAGVLGTVGVLALARRAVSPQP